MIHNPPRLDGLPRTVRSFMREVAIPIEARVERDERIPEEIVHQMRDLGFFGRSIPQPYGGAGLTTEELALASRIHQLNIAKQLLRPAQPAKEA